MQRPSVAGDFYTQYYSRLSQESLHSTRKQSRYWQVVKQVSALRQIRHSALDVGCGDGDLCYELRQAGWSEVIGQDISRSRIARARVQYPDLQFYDVPLEQTNIPRTSQDLVIIDNVIEHVPQPVEFLATLREYLKPSGLLVAITPNMESGNFRLLGRRWTPELAPHTHIFLFTHDAIRRCLQLSGFDVIAQGDFYVGTVSPIQILKRVLKGDLKGGLWRIMQDAGSVYARLTKSGPMLFAVASPCK